MHRDTGRAGKARLAWRAFLVLVLGSGVGVIAGLYLLSSRHEQQELRWVTHIAAASLREDIKSDVEFETSGLIRLAMLAGRISSSEQAWTENARLFIQRRPGCTAIEVLTPAYQRVSIVYASAAQRPPLAFGGIPTELLKAAAESTKPVMSPFIAMGNRSTQRITVIPILHGDSGFVVAFFDARESFDRMILDDNKDLGFSLAILERGQEQYRMVRDSKENEAQPAFTEADEIAFPGVTWQLRVWPQPDTLHAMNANLPELTLVVGALIFLLLASTVYFAYSATAQSRKLADLNGELTMEIGQREKAEEELRRAHDELEARVQQRTAELSLANAKLEQEIAEHARAEESLQRLTGQLFQLQDEERRRLARELHDGATQNLIALGMNMATLRDRALSSEQRTELLDDSARLIQESVGELRTTSHLLHPPLIDELGLRVTLRSYVDTFSARSGIRVMLVVDPELGRMDRDVELAMFRIVQESLANVHRHSHSDTADILLSRDATDIHLEISDKGTGIPPDILSRTERGLAGVGIAGMRERVRLLGGRFEVSSGKTGTTIRILVPLKEAKASDDVAVGAHVA